MANKVFIIAEAGVNHNGSIENAKLLIDAAVTAGVDAVKFQTFTAENSVVRDAPKATYQIEATGTADTQYEMLKKLELSYENHQELKEYCTNKGIMFFSTGFDLDSLDYLKKIGLTLAKVPSGELTNYPYLTKMAQLFPEIIISTGMADLSEIGDALNIFLAGGIEKDNITVLHCNTQYPTPMEDVNLKAMLQIQNEYGVAIGYSDHTLGIEVPIAAVALGATVIEKHFTLDRSMEGPDHAASLEPDELAHMVLAIRNVEKAIAGDGVKKASPSELENKAIARKSIVARRDIKEGEVFDESNLTVKRPGTGVSPMRWNEVVGQLATRDYQADEFIQM